MNRPLKHKQLACFIAVAEELNFRLAAERLHMTQPPLSRQIQQLEAVLGVALFERSRQGVRITEAGERFLPDARALLEQADAMLEKARDYATAPGQALNIGITTVVDAQALPDLASLFQSQHPGIKLNVVPQRSLGLIKALKRGELDVALIGLPSLTEDLQVERLFDDPLVVAVPARHPLARKRQLALADLQAETVFWFRRALNPAYYDHCMGRFKAFNFSPDFIPEPADHHVLLGMIANGQGIALIPGSLKAIKRQGVVYKRLLEGERLSIGIGVALRPDEASALVRAFVESVRGYYARRSEGTRLP
ncbi:LysR family transcriptional regulator [Chitinimonas naiadis]